MQTKYKRVLIKLSGEALAGEKGFGLDDATLASIAKVIKECTEMGVQVAAVVGGGNFWRGRTGESMDRTRADHMGMLATVINSLALLDALEQQGVSARVQTAIEMRQIADILDRVSKEPENEAVLDDCRKTIQTITKKFPLYGQYALAQVRKENHS